MKRKYNDDSIYFKDWTTKKLKQEAIAADHSIHVTECYGISEVWELDEDDDGVSAGVREERNRTQHLPHL